MVTRMSGCFSRSGSRYAPGPPVPRVHRRPPLCRSSGLPVIFHSSPSSLYTLPAHFQKHMSQIVGVVLTVPVPGNGFAAQPPSIKAGDAAALAPSSEDNLMNSRRFTASLPLSG